MTRKKDIYNGVERPLPVIVENADSKRVSDLEIKVRRLTEQLMLLQQTVDKLTIALKRQNNNIGAMSDRLSRRP